MKTRSTLLTTVIAAAICSWAALTQARDNHHPPGPAHASSMPLEARSVEQTSRALAAKPRPPVVVTAKPPTIQPRGGNPHVTLNPQPIPPGRLKAKTR